MPDSDREGRIFLSIRHTHDRLFSCTPFISERRVFDNAVTSIADVRYIVITLLWRLMALILRSVTLTFTTACVTSITTSDFYLTLGRITWVG